mmetsp:Transcript_30522/g.98349  ORF Transcript_30522/g.98349 Transcript_30522/m.98349 type:complete len:206 (+) Transcript_30522:526-1143(+)
MPGSPCPQPSSITLFPLTGSFSCTRYSIRSNDPSQTLKPPSYTPDAKSDLSITSAMGPSRLSELGGRQRFNGSLLRKCISSNSASIAISSSSSSLPSILTSFATKCPCGVILRADKDSTALETSSSLLPKLNLKPASVPLSAPDAAKLNLKSIAEKVRGRWSRRSARPAVSVFLAISVFVVVCMLLALLPSLAPITDLGQPSPLP